MSDPALTGNKPLPRSVVQRVEQRCLRFRVQWQAGPQPTIQDYLRDVSEPEYRAALRELLAVELEFRQAEGESPTLKEYHDRFPAYLDVIEAVFHSGTSTVLGPGSDGRFHWRLPRRFGRYDIQKMLGRGGMGDVYLARDTQLFDRLVALKVPQFVPANNPELYQRFRAEVAALASLLHPHICIIHDAGEICGIPFLAMAYIEGEPLTAFIPPAGKRLSEQDKLDLVRKVAEAMHEAHQRHILHRDLKPSNIMRNQRGEPVIMDFGLARRLDLVAEPLTQPGAILGTYQYMAPELVHGHAADAGPACDIYSLGVILVELLTGKRALPGPQESAHLDPQLRAICRQATEPASEDRWPDMKQFAEALANVLKQQEAAAHPAAEVLPPSLADPRVAAAILNRLRQLGWEKGLEQLEAEIQTTTDADRRAALQFFLGWRASERGAHAQAETLLQAAQPALRGWALVGRAFVALRRSHHAEAHQFLDRATAQLEPNDTALRATIAHYRAAVLFREGRDNAALPLLCEALELFGKDHFGTGRVLDTLGMVHAHRGNFHTAREFYEQAIAAKERHDDTAGLALTHGQLGRLFLDWEEPAEAAHHFRKDLELATASDDQHGVARMYDQLGQVLLAQGHYPEAAVSLDASIRLCVQHRWTVAEGFARKDRALLYLAEDNLDGAEHEIQRADELFQSLSFAEGRAHVQRVQGMVRGRQQKFAEAEDILTLAATQFNTHGEPVEAARTLLELVRTRRAHQLQQRSRSQRVRNETRQRILGDLLQALDRAEQGRHGPLIRTLERELREVDPTSYWQRAYRLSNGDLLAPPQRRDMEGTVLLLELRGFAKAGQPADPEMAFQLLTPILAEFAAVLEEHQMTVAGYHGFGLTAIASEREHARRAVAAALEMVQALAAFNRPRKVLELACAEAHIGISTGEVLLTHVGTCARMDLTALGGPVQLAAGLLGEAEPGLPAISEAVYQLVAPRFTFRGSGSRKVKLKGMGEQRIWDVVGPKN